MENEELYRSLVIMLKMFKNRPYHLAKYLVENSALTEDFIKKIKNSDRLKELNKEDESSNQKLLPVPVPVYFVDISQMENFYNSFIDDIKQLSKEKNIEEITKDLNKKLDALIKQEKYEEAARVRDYMNRNKIKRIF
jgi:excinuclease UvrABC helicase subunit UvrB